MLSVITPTHDPRHLAATARSLMAQTLRDWEWVVLVNGSVTVDEVREAIGDVARGDVPDTSDPRIRVEQWDGMSKSIGEIKREAFSRGTGDVLVELDHDDLLASTALAELEEAFRDPATDFAYSNSTDFCENGLFHYYPDWHNNGWRYRDTIVDGAGVVECVSFPPSAASLSLIYYAPNHVRAWRRSFYERIGGHDRAFAIGDDHELLLRTYLNGRMKHIDKCLYLYRMGSQNTFALKIAEIERLTYTLHAQNIDALVRRESELRGLPCYDLGGAINGAPGWTVVDRVRPDKPTPFVRANLCERWPFADSSVMAFRAHDIIEHVADKQHVMSELHRCLVPGGWALISVPSTDGRGAFQDPTHVSFWNQNSFWYWTRPQTAAYIRNTSKMFMARRLFTHFPSAWHEENRISYVTAELTACKGDMTGIPGVRP